MPPGGTNRLSRSVRIAITQSVVIAKKFNAIPK